jgi:hypothetical protein
MKSTILVIGAVAFGLLAPATASAGPVLEQSPFPYYQTVAFSTDYTLGWSFTTNQAFNVGALDAYQIDTGGSQVRLYNATGTILASATVVSTDPVEGSPFSFYSQAISPVALAAGQTYYIAEDVGSGTGALVAGFGLTTDPAITYGSAVSANGLGNDPTTDVFGGGYDPGYFGPNFDIATSSVPEPATLTLFGIGALGGILWHAGRRWKERATTDRSRSREER